MKSSGIAAISSTAGFLLGLLLDGSIILAAWMLFVALFCGICAFLIDLGDKK